MLHEPSELDAHVSGKERKTDLVTQDRSSLLGNTLGDRSSCDSSWLSASNDSALICPATFKQILRQLSGLAASSLAYDAVHRHQTIMRCTHESMETVDGIHDDIEALDGKKQRISLLVDGQSASLSVQPQRAVFVYRGGSQLAFIFCRSVDSGTWRLSSWL